MNFMQFQLIFSCKKLKTSRKSRTVQWHYFCLSQFVGVRRSSSEFVGTWLFQQTSRKFRVWHVFSSFSWWLHWFPKNHGNSRLDNVFQVFHGVCIDFPKKSRKFKAWQCLSSFSWWLHWFPIQSRKFKAWQCVSIFSWWLHWFPIKSRKFKVWHLSSSVSWWLQYFSRKQGEVNEWQICSNFHWWL